MRILKLFSFLMLEIVHTHASLENEKTYRAGCFNTSHFSTSRPGSKLIYNMKYFYFSLIILCSEQNKKAMLSTTETKEGQKIGYTIDEETQSAKNDVSLDNKARRDDSLQKSLRTGTLSSQ